MPNRTPPLTTVPHPGVWRANRAELKGGLIITMAQSLDRMLPLQLFERMVRFIWNRTQKPEEVPLVVLNCGNAIEMAGITFHRIHNGVYANFEDRVRGGTGAAMHYSLHVENRKRIVGIGALTAPAPIVGAFADVSLDLLSAEDDHWTVLCGAQIPPCSDLDGTCG